MVRTRGSHAGFSVNQLLLDFDEQWPSLKYIGFGFFYAWIFLSYNSGILFVAAGDDGSACMLSMFVISTTAASFMLVVAALFHKVFEPLIARQRFVLLMSSMASIGTAVVSLSCSRGGADPVFVLGSLMTGIGTAFVVLRTGTVYAHVAARQALMYSASSFLIAALLYFMCVAVPPMLGVVLAVFLPAVAALCTMVAVQYDDESDAIVTQRGELPAGFFPRLIVSILVISMIPGVAKGMIAATVSIFSMSNQGVIIVFSTSVLSGVLVVLAGLTRRDFDISKLYYPIILLACFGVLSIILFNNSDPAFATFSSVAYNLFILMIWCLLAHVANRTNYGAVYVFGWGRGASAAGTTIGWLVGAYAAPVLLGDAYSMAMLCIGMVLALLVVSMLVLNERTMGSALSHMGVSDGAVDQQTVDSAQARADADLPDSPTLKGGGSWSRSCNKIAEECALSGRERDVLFLLGKGRSTDYIADELCISHNTSKSHIRNVYSKLGVHSRQELLDLIETERGTIVDEGRAKD